MLCAAGGSSPTVSKSDSRVAAVGSSYSTWEGRGHRPRIWLPIGISWRQEAFRCPVLTGLARQKGNSFRNWDSLQYLCVTSMVKCCIFHIFRLILPVASTDTCECHKTRRYIILVELWINIIYVFIPFPFSDSFDRLYKAVTSLPPRLEYLLWAGINELINITPEGQFPSYILCYLIKCVFNIWLIFKKKIISECLPANVTVSVLVINTTADIHQHHLEKVESP